MSDRTTPATGNRHVVTGAGGFLGTHLRSSLAAAGHDVVGVDITPPTSGEDWVRANCADLDAMRRVFRGADVVHHTVAHVPLRRPSAASFEANAVSPGVVATACRLEGVRQLVLVGSSAVYGLPDRSPLPESSVPTPFEAYGRAKLAGELSARQALDGANTRLAILRPRTILGGGRLGIFHTLFQFIAEGRNVYTIGRADGPLQFVHVDDVITAHLTLAEGADGVFAVGADRYTTLRTELEALIVHAGSSSRVVSLPSRPTRAALAALWQAHLSPLSPWHYEGYAHPFDVTTDGLRALGWQPQWSNSEMLVDAWESFRVTTNAGPTSTTGPVSVHRTPVRQQALGLLRRLS